MSLIPFHKNAVMAVMAPLVDREGVAAISVQAMNDQFHTFCFQDHFSMRARPCEVAGCDFIAKEPITYRSSGGLF
jgi:hypothetical protein